MQSGCFCLLLFSVFFSSPFSLFFPRVKQWTHRFWFRVVDFSPSALNHHFSCSSFPLICVAPFKCWQLYRMCSKRRRGLLPLGYCGIISRGFIPSRLSSSEQLMPFVLHCSPTPHFFFLFFFSPDKIYNDISDDLIWFGQCPILLKVSEIWLAWKDLR